MKNKNLIRLPKQEDVQEFDLGKDGVIKLVELNEENRPAVLDVVISMYMDDECMYCHRNFTFEEVKKSRWTYPNSFGRIVHKECWEANNP